MSLRTVLLLFATPVCLLLAGAIVFSSLKGIERLIEDEFTPQGFNENQRHLDFLVPEG